MTKSDILQFMSSHKLCVVSTYTAGEYPESALMGFGQTDALELILGTSSKTRKHRNFLANNKVSVVIGLDESGLTLQYEGIIEPMQEAEKEQHLANYHIKIPTAAKYKDNPDQTYWKVTPVWMRYTNLHNNTVKEFEFGP